MNLIDKYLGESTIFKEGDLIRGAVEMPFNTEMVSGILICKIDSTFYLMAMTRRHYEYVRVYNIEKDKAKASSGLMQFAKKHQMWGRGL